MTSGRIREDDDRWRLTYRDGRVADAPDEQAARQWFADMAQCQVEGIRLHGGKML